MTVSVYVITVLMLFLWAQNERACQHPLEKLVHLICIVTLGLALMTVAVVVKAGFDSGKLVW